MAQDDDQVTIRVGAVSAYAIDAAGGPRKFMADLENVASGLPLVDPGAHELSRMGFAPFVRDMPAFIPLPDGAGGAVRVGMHRKVIPAGAVVAEIERRCDEIEAKTGARPKSSLRKTIREAVLHDFCAKALHVTRYCHVLVDVKHARLFVIGASTSFADEVVAMIYDKVEGCCFHPDLAPPDMEIAFASTARSLLMEAAGITLPGGLAVGIAEKAKFVNSGSGESMTLACRKDGHSVSESDAAQAAIRNGYEGTMARLVASDAARGLLLYMDLSEKGKISGLCVRRAVDSDDDVAVGGLTELSARTLEWLTACQMAAAVVQGLFPGSEQEGFGQDEGGREEAA